MGRNVVNDNVVNDNLVSAPVTGAGCTSSPPGMMDDARLQPIAEKVLAGERLNADDGATLYRTPDLLGLGWLANHARERRHGNVTYFNVNRHINPTNVCVAHCKLCAFGRDPNAPGAYTFALEEI